MKDISQGGKDVSRSKTLCDLTMQPILPTDITSLSVDNAEYSGHSLNTAYLKHLWAAFMHPFISISFY